MAFATAGKCFEEDDRVLPQLPINGVLDRLAAVLAGGSAVLTAPPGSGKTTLVPLALRHQDWLGGQTILVLEPRRLAARMAAARMAELLGEEVGQTVGYQIRHERRISAQTRIEVLTEGILTRRLQQGGELSGVGLIIFDEFHERSIHADLALALCLDLCQLREDLRLLVMSATLDAAPIAALLGGVPVISCEGRSYEVELGYLTRPPAGSIAQSLAAGVARVVRERAGDILAFLPGGGEIDEALRLLRQDESCRDSVVLPLFGDLSRAEQDLALRPDPGGRRRIILATSIAETSLTIEGIGNVVDSGWSRRPRFQPASGLSGLATLRVSKAAATQRAGRAGRLGPGYCLRLWTREEEHRLPPFHPPEILAVDLAGLILELALWGVSDPAQLRWLDPPRLSASSQARELLVRLGALDQAGRTTDHGRRLAELPLHPRLGHMLVMGTKRGLGPLAADLAALLGERDPLGRRGREGSAEISLRLELLGRWRSRGDREVVKRGGDPVVCRRIDEESRRLLTLVGCRGEGGSHAAAGDLLCYAYPDRIARRRPGQVERYLLATGRGALLPPGDPLAASEFLVAAHLDAGRSEGRIFLAEGVDKGALEASHGHLFETVEEVVWDAQGARVAPLKRVMLGRVIVSEGSWLGASREAMAAVMAEGIGRLGLSCLPWEKESRRLQARILFCARHHPEEGWPEVGDQQLVADLGWLAPYLADITRADQLRQLDLVAILNDLLPWQQRRLLDELAPKEYPVPSGSRIAIDYPPEGQPILAVRLQELFGLAETPTIAGGRVTLLLHLLSPARRPIQVTSDLPGFWRGSYQEVKKELKGRYPKHHWPDDPLTAEATRGVKWRKK